MQANVSLRDASACATGFSLEVVGVIATAHKATLLPGSGSRYMRDPRLFEALPALLVKNARQVDWTKLTSAAYSLGLQNRLGGVVATALRLGADERV